MIATPPQVSVWVQPGRQLHILLWVELFVHLRYYNHVEVVIRISRIDVKRRSFQNISNSTWLILTKRVRSLIIVLLPRESDNYKITTIISIDYWPLDPSTGVSAVSSESCCSRKSSIARDFSFSSLSNFQVGDDGECLCKGWAMMMIKHIWEGKDYKWKVYSTIFLIDMKSSS